MLDTEDCFTIADEYYYRVVGLSAAQIGFEWALLNERMPLSVISSSCSDAHVLLDI